ncbi:YbaY family lipoprotein [Halopseudomonas sp.]|uniref:YbaY family lipoprotein n=1 Tax=Halopseudomonas sp. TaxID=2901191 RepID=UPI0030036F8F
MYTITSQILLIGLAGMLAAGCTTTASKDTNEAQEEQAAPATEQVTGQISYRERIPLPDGSVAHIKLSDVSRADAPATVLAEQNTTLFGRSVPIPFSLKVEPAMFDLRMRYSVSAQIRSPEGQLLWTTDSANLIDVTQPVEDLGTIMMIKVSGAVAEDAEIVDANALLPFAARGNEPGWVLKVDSERMSLSRQNVPTTILTPTPTTTREQDSYRFNASTEANSVIVDVTPQLCRDSMTGMPYPYEVSVKVNGDTLTGCGGAAQSLLTGREWIVEDVDSKGVIDNTQMSLNFTNEGLLGGRAACNQYTTSYQLSGEGLQTKAIASTQKACSEALMNQDEHFLEVLGDVARFEIDDTGALILTTTDNRTIKARAAEADSDSQP